MAIASEIIFVLGTLINNYKFGGSLILSHDISNTSKYPLTCLFNLKIHILTFIYFADINESLLFPGILINKSSIILKWIFQIGYNTSK